jgi:geranylgeranyl pyrophosphate synthase
MPADEMKNLYAGQSLDLYWTYNVVCPSLPEYLKMVDKSTSSLFLSLDYPNTPTPLQHKLTITETGGLFRLLARFMMACSPSKTNQNLLDLSTLFGRLFQIRDDYQNLSSADVSLSPHSSLPSKLTKFLGAQYTKQKGFCEDLDEGKYSLPLIHALGAEPHNLQLRSVLIERRVAGHSTTEHKKLVLENLARTKSLEFTAHVMKTLHAETMRTIDKVEKDFGNENFSLRLALSMLSV